MHIDIISMCFESSPDEEPKVSAEKRTLEITSIFVISRVYALFNPEIRNLNYYK